MPTLYVENVPDQIYEALRKRAQEHRKSISAEVLNLLAENVPTDEELVRRKAILARITKIRAKKPPSRGPFLTSEQMLREDRDR